MKRLLLLLLMLASPCWAQQSIVIPATMASVPITVSTNTTTLLVTGISGKSIYVTNAFLLAAGITNVQFIAGTGSTCGTGTINITGNINLTAQVGFVLGVGNGVVLVVPSGLSLCLVSSGSSIAVPGSLAYAIF